jgi:predicted kinase
MRSRPGSGSPLPSALILVTGPPGAGKSTLAPQLAERLGAPCISRDEIHNMVFDAWGEHDFEAQGKLNWDLFRWMLAQVATRTCVVGETPINHAINRSRLLELRASLGVPFVEVFLSGDPDELLRRVERRAAAPGAHPIKARFTVDGARRLLAAPYEPLLGDAASTIRVDTTDLDAVSLGAITDEVQRLVTGQS